MSILDSIRSLFSTKEEDLNPTVKSVLNFFNRGAEANQAVGEKIALPLGKTFVQPVIRSIPETFMSLKEAITGQKQNQIDLPKPIDWSPEAPPIQKDTNYLTDLFLGSKPLKTIQQRTPEFSKEYNVPIPIAAGAVTLGTALDLPGPGMVKNLFKEGAEKVVERLGKEIGKEGAAFTVKELAEKVPQTFLKQLIEKGGIETATHTITYDPIRKFIDILPKVVEEVKPEIKVATEIVPKVAGIRTKVQEAKNAVEEAKNLAKGTAQVAQEQRAVFDPDMISLAKKLAKTKAYTEGDVETLKTLKNGEYSTFISDLVEKVRSMIDPAMTDSDAFKYVSELPTKAETAVKRSGIKVAQEELQLADAELKNAIKGKGVRVYKEGASDIAPAKRQLKSTFDDTMDLADKTLDESLNAGKATGFGLGPDDISKQEVKGFATSLQDIRESLPGQKVSIRGEATVPSEVFKELPTIKPQLDVPFKQTPRALEGFLGKKSATEKWINGTLKEGTRAFQNYIKASQDKLKPLFEGMSKAEREAITLFGEGTITPDELAIKFPQSYQKIINADSAIRQYFDEAYSLVNESRQRIGLDPIGYTKNYYTVMEDTAKKASDMLNTPADVRGYGVEKNKWVTKFAGFLKSRRAGVTVEDRLLDAQEILSDYIRAAGYQINITPAIERMNNLAKTAGEFAQEAPNRDAIIGFKNWIESRAALLAGQKSSGEKALGQTFSPVFADFLKHIRGSVGRNLVTKSPTSGFTNLVPLIKYVTPEAGADNMAIGLKRAITAPMTEANNFIANGIQSQFLRNRYEVPAISETIIQKLSNLEWPVIGFQKMDQFAANASFYAMQERFLKEGKSLAEATQLADDTLARILTDRSLGQLPNLIMDKGLGSLFTMFLPERLNELFLQYADTLTGLKGPQKLKALSQFVYYTMAGFAVNELSQELFGRKFTDSIASAVKDTIDQHSETDSIFQTGLKGLKNVASQLPFAEVISGDSKLPITAGFPSLRQIQEEPGLAAAKFASIYLDPTGFARPAVRAIESGLAINKGYVGGSQVKYPVPQDILGKLKMLLLGTSSTKEAREYYDRGYTPLTDKDTLAYKTIYQSGDDDQAFLLWKALEAKKYITNPINKIKQLEFETSLLMSQAKTEEERNEIARKFAVLVGKAAKEAQSRAAEVVPEIQQASNKLPLTSPTPSGRTQGINVGKLKGLSKPTLKVPKTSISFSTSGGVKAMPARVAQIKPIEPIKEKSKLAGLRVRERNA